VKSGEIARELAPGDACGHPRQRDIRLAVIIVERIEVGANCCPIATRDRPGKCASRSVFGDVSEGCFHHSPEPGWVDVEPTCEGFDFGTECNKVIGCDRRSRVIHRTIVVVNIEGDASEQIDQDAAGGVASDGELAAIEQACRSDRRIGE
jgi:hypothetical protein